MVVIVILTMMLFQWGADGSVDIPTQDSDLSDEPIKEAVSRSALNEGNVGGRGNPIHISRFLASKGEVNNGTVSFALGTRGSGISNLKSVPHIKRTH